MAAEPSQARGTEPSEACLVKNSSNRSDSVRHVSTSWIASSGLSVSLTRLHDTLATDMHVGNDFCFLTEAL